MPLSTNLDTYEIWQWGKHGLQNLPHSNHYHVGNNVLLKNFV